MTIRKILIVIPAYNEEDNITTVINELRDEYPSYDYVIVQWARCQDQEGRNLS